MAAKGEESKAKTEARAARLLVPQEVAEQQFDDLIEAWDLGFGIERIEEKDREDFEDIRARIIYNIKRGRAEVIDDTIVYQLQHPSGALTELRMGLCSGRDLMAIDKIKQGREVERGHVYLSGMCKLPVATFKTMDPRDFKFCQAVSLLFTGS